MDGSRAVLGKTKGFNSFAVISIVQPNVIPPSSSTVVSVVMMRARFPETSI